MKIKSKKLIYIPLSFLLLILALFAFSGMILSAIGGFLVVDEVPVSSDAVVVLNTGVEYYPRLIEAANLYNQGFAQQIVLNGNRKTETLRELEARGLKHCCPWFEERVRILELYGVPRKDVITINAEDVYDTITEARVVGEEIVRMGKRNIIIVTSKSHTRRARHIWKDLFGVILKITVKSASTDPYSIDTWWRQGRQVKWVLSEYGAWMYYYMQKIR